MSVPVSRAALAGLVGEWRAEGLDDAEFAGRILSLLSSDAKWAKAFGHPLRGEILGSFARQGPMSPVQMSEAIDASLATVAYHFRVLSGLGLLELDHEVPRRGAIEHVYRLPETPS